MGKIVRSERVIGNSYSEILAYKNGRPLFDGNIKVAYERKIDEGKPREHVSITYGPHHLDYIMPLMKSNPAVNVIEWDSKEGLIEPKRAVHINDLDDRVVECLAETPKRVRRCLAKFVQGYRA